MVFIGVSKAAFNIGEFKTISNDVGVFDDWVKLDPNNSHTATEDFGLAYCISKVYMVSRRNGSAVQGGVVSSLVDGKWKHGSFGKLDGDQYRDELFTLYGRLFMLTVSDMSGRIEFHNLFVWDVDKSIWTAVNLDISDKDNIFQKLERGPRKFVSIDVPHQDSKIAYIVATDHEMANTDSSTSFSKLEVAFDKDAGSTPLNASLKFINRIKLDVGKAVIASAVKDGRLYALVANFAKDNAITAKISIDYAIDLMNNNSKVDGIKLDNASMPEIDFTVGKDRIFQAKDMLLFLGAHKVNQDSTITRHVWDLDLAQKKMQDVDAKFPDLPNRIYAIDQTQQLRLLTADLKKGAYAAMINA